MSEPCSCGGSCGCGCCEGVEPLTPQTIANRPGLDALSYRVGTHSTFLETMTARLSSEALMGLTSRESGDPSLALLDAWAVVGDVLSFYQERIANEGYLRTATERRSVLELARLVGYAPRPGVAASAYLAYTLDPGPEALIPAGAAVRSVPGPGELPQVFETMEDLTARAAWNNLQVRLTRPQSPMTFNRTEIHLQGISTQLRVNDPLLIGSFGFMELFRILAIEPDTAKDRTRIAIQPWSQTGVIEAFGMESVQESSLNIEALRGILASFVDLESHGLTPKKTTDRVIHHLDPLKESLESGTGEAAIRARIEELLPTLRKELVTVKNLGSDKLQAWISGLIEELEPVVGPVPKSENFQMEAVNEPPKPTSLANVLGSLAKAPSRPPRGSAHLNRDITKLLEDPGSDVQGKLLAVARPELRDTLYKAWANAPVTQPSALEVYALRARASVFGHNAPMEQERSEDEDGVVTFTPREWTLQRNESWTEEPQVVWLDTTYPQVLPGGWIVLHRPSATEQVPELLIARVQQTGDRSRAEYGIAAKATRITLDRTWIDLERAEGGGDLDTFAVVRGTAVYAQSEKLALAEIPIADPVCDSEIELAALYDGLQPGRWLIVSGERTDVGELNPEGKVEVPVPGIPAAELVMLAGVEQGVSMIGQDTSSDTSQIPLPGDRTHSTITLATPLAYCYRRDTLKIYGNVAKATHGESRFEVMGSGDAAKSLQSFTLKQPPLTHISAPTPSGIESTLKVRVNDVLWHEADSLAGLRPTDRSYIVRIDDGGQTTVVFGNGERGARLPTGPENVRANYRSGIGKGGNVKAGQLSQLGDRPHGVKDVINPLPATGGADRESRDQLRRNAPLAVLALDRLVSVQDYEDFTRTFAGIGKARAASLSDGRVQLVHVTIAGEDDIPIGADSELLQNLEAALRRFGDPRQPFLIEVRERSFLVVEAEVRVLPDYLWEKVEPKIRAAMLEAFGFDRRDLGQGAQLSEAYRVLQSVPGVDFVDINVFASRNPEDLSGELEQPPRVRSARVDADGIHPAQMLYLSPEVADTLILKERKS